MASYRIRGGRISLLTAAGYSRQETGIKILLMHHKMWFVKVALLRTKCTILESRDMSRTHNEVLSAAIRLLVGCAGCGLAVNFRRSLNFVDVMIR